MTTSFGHPTRTSVVQVHCNETSQVSGPIASWCFRCLKHSTRSCCHPRPRASWPKCKRACRRISTGPSFACRFLRSERPRCARICSCRKAHSRAPRRHSLRHLRATLRLAAPRTTMTIRSMVWLRLALRRRGHGVDRRSRSLRHYGSSTSCTNATRRTYRDCKWPSRACWRSRPATTTCA